MQVPGRLVDIPALAEKCSLVIALRSGICDLLALSKTKMLVIVPSREDYLDKPEFDDITGSADRVLFDPKCKDEENITAVLRRDDRLLGSPMFTV